MTQKFVQALGIFLVGQLVAYVGLSDRVRPEDWPEATARTLAWIFAGLLILIAILAAAGLRRYAIERARHEARLAALAPPLSAADAREREPPGPQGTLEIGRASGWVRVVKSVWTA